MLLNVRQGQFFYVVGWVPGMHWADKVADMEVDNVVNKVADMVADKVVDSEVYKEADMVVICVGHTASRSQAGPKGAQLEVGAQRAPRPLVNTYFLWLIDKNFKSL